MTANLEIHDLPAAGQLQVCLAEPTGSRREAPQAPFALELSDDERAALDQYHREYYRPTVGRPAPGGRGRGKRCGIWAGCCLK